jgi:hypothetical protein
MNRLDRITRVLATVQSARHECPFSASYLGRDHHGPYDTCKKCSKRRDGGGGGCVVDLAEHAAILEIEEAVS